MMDYIPYINNNEVYTCPVEEDVKAIKYNENNSMEQDELTSKPVQCKDLTARPARHDVVSRSVAHLGKMSPQHWKLTNNKTCPRNIHMRSIQWKEIPHQSTTHFMKRPQEGANNNKLSNILFVLIWIAIFIAIIIGIYYAITSYLKQ